MKTKTLRSHALTTLLVSSLLAGCATTSIEQRSAESPARVHLVRPEAEAPVRGVFRYEEGAVVGELAWQNACRREEVREVTSQKVAVRSVLSKPASYTLLALGVAAVVGGAYAVSKAGDGRHADYRSCSDTSNDECKSPRELMTEAGVGLILSGLGVGGMGVVGLAATPRVEPLGPRAVVDRRVRTLEPRAACGAPEALGGITLAVTPPGAEPSFGTTDEQGRVHIALGPRALGAHGGRLQVEVTEVPEVLRATLSPSTVLGEVSVPPPPPVEAATQGGGAGQGKRRPLARAAKN